MLDVLQHTANSDRGFKLEQIGLFKEDFSGENAELPDLGLGELNMLAWP